MGQRLSSPQLLTLLAAFALAAPLAQCGSDSSSTFPSGGDGGAGSSGGSSGAFPATPDSGTGSSGSPSEPHCGDGNLASNEACDDGNTSSNDGCSATCAIEAGWACPTVGIRCEAAKCGDGIVAGTEECDYPGAPVTGCGSDCKIAPGYDCDPTTLACHQVVCGDGKVERGESCEDGNDLPFDGCYKCQKEPACTDGVCQGACGDGQRFSGEACDDGNTRSGDGCSATCTIETGFTCTDVVGDPPDTIDQPILIRDFIGVGNGINGGAEFTDFNQLGGNGVLGITENDLDPDGGRMILACDGSDCSQNPGHLYFGGKARPNISTRANFDQWYRNLPVNIPSVFTATLARKPDGTYVWDSGDPTQNAGKNYFDPVGTGGWVDAGKEQEVCNPLRNCSFTSETHFWFEYNGGERFDFAGDDDTWIFVNGHLAVDLGGLHTPLAGYFILDDDTDGDAGPDIADGGAFFSENMPPASPETGPRYFGLKKGGVYEVVMFQAERNQCGSNFKVTLKDFNRPKSTCASTCGDGIVASDEVCDDGKNDASYGGCMPGCKARPPRCGDGIVQAGNGEQCDDANTNNNDGCTNGCKLSGVQ